MKTGEEEALQVKRKDQYGQDMIVQASWTTSSGTGRLSLSLGDRTILTVLEPGEIVVLAIADDISATKIFQIDPRIPTRITASPTEPLLSYGSTQNIDWKYFIYSLLYFLSIIYNLCYNHNIIEKINGR